MNLEYAKLMIASLAFSALCLVAVLRPDSVAPVKEVAIIIVSGSIGAVGGSALSTTLASQASAQIAQAQSSASQAASQALSDTANSAKNAVLAEVVQAATRKRKVNETPEPETEK